MPRVSRNPDVGNDIPQNTAAHARTVPVAKYDEEVQLEYRGGGGQQPFVDPRAPMPAYGYAQQPFSTSTSHWPAPPPGLPMAGEQPHHLYQPGAGPPPPGQWQFMPAPHTVPGCPPGLEYLMTLDQIHVRQKVHMIECKYSPVAREVYIDLRS